MAMSPSMSKTGARFVLARQAVIAVNFLSRKLGRGSGTVAGGRVGLRLDHDLLGQLLVGRDVVFVSGTNGKTTTTALVRAALQRASASNTTGANMPAGLVAALASDDTPWAVLEVDEPFLPEAVEAARDARSTTIVLLNLSRDQLDRSSEVRQLAQRWRDMFARPTVAARVRVIANVNDPLVAWSVTDLESLVAVALPNKWNLDATSCPSCTRVVSTASEFDCQCHGERVTAGTWTCTCGLQRPEPDVILDEYLHVARVKRPFVVDLPGDFNRANAAIAVATAVSLGVSVDDAVAGASRVTTVEGRFEVRQRYGKQWRLMLAKNPVGFAALIDTLATNGDDLVIAINDLVADGRDPSWLYDVPFERLGARKVWCQGTRMLDLATRLEYGGVAFELADGDDLANVTFAARGPIDVIANYTAFSAWRQKSFPC